jgi:peptide/nickel transport system ATP-binding protein
MTPVLEITGLRTHIRQRTTTVQAVDGVSLTIAAGETLGLVGESGSGKTMTGLSAIRLLPPGGRIADGSIKINGTEIVGLPGARMREIRGGEVGMIFQDPMTSLNPTMPVGEQIAETVRVHKHVSRAAAVDRAVEVLDLVGMPQPRERLGDFPHQLSGGLRQRVMIAMALACEPSILIADEPTTAVDVTIQAQILGLLDKLKAELGTAMLLISHDMGVIAGRADRVAVMYAGRIVEQADTVEFFDHIRHPYAEALLASIPQPGQDTGRALYSIPGSPPDLSDPPPACRFATRCRYATDQCRAEDPKLTSGEHQYACFHPVPVDAAVPRAAGLRLLATLRARPPRPVADSGSDSDSGADLLLDARDLVKEYPITKGVLQRAVGSVKAVSGVSLSIRAGETFGLVGESGCGKTTIGRLLVGLERLTSGQILFSGTDISGLGSRGRLGSAAGQGRRRGEVSRLRRDLQLMFQDPYSSLDPRMRVGAILREPLVIQGIGSRQEQDKAIADMLAEVGLRPSVVDRYPHEFSGGQRQRIGLARALMLGPRLLIADEPVSALDVSIRSQILNLMRDLQDRHHLSYLIISHDLAVVRYMSDRIGVVYLGKLVEVGPAADVYASPAHPYTAALISAIPSPDPHTERGRDRSQVRGELPSAASPPSGCRFRTRCPIAEDICAEAEPPLRSFGPGHLAACHFPLQPLVAAAAGLPVVNQGDGS